MREVTDALRSLKRYVAEVLNEWEPPIAVITYSTQAYTIGNQVAGATNVSLAAWNWLLSQDRVYDLVTHGAPDAPATYYLESPLVADPTAAAASAGIDLTGATVAATAIPYLGDWEVRFWADRGEFKRPFARVGLVGRVALGGPALITDMTQPFSIECYPAVGLPENGWAADDSLFAAAQVESRLLAGFRGAGVGYGRPMRIPLFDYEGLALTDGAGDANRATTSDYMRLTDFSTQILPYPEDPLTIAVVCDLRLSWRRAVGLEAMKSRSGASMRGRRIVQTVNITEDVS